MGQPFLLMLRAELVPAHGAAAAGPLAKHVYDVAREIAVNEAVAGQRLRDCRDALILRIRARDPVNSGPKAA